jgi:hypothetical protein
MRHLKPDEVDYATRPLTIHERQLFVFLENQAREESHPQYYQLWAAFFWSRQNEVLPSALFHDILLPDFEDHKAACLKALKEADVIQLLSDNWRFEYRGLENKWNKKDVLEEMEIWKGRHEQEDS